MLLFIFSLLIITFLKESFAGDVCSTASCSQKCRPTPAGYECYCNEGFMLQNDNRTCSDINECLSDGFCSQQCTNWVGSYNCSCMEGYDLINRTCLVPDPEPLLLYSTMQEIRAISLRTRRSFLVHQAVIRVTSVDTDPLESKVYWVEVSNKSSVYATKIDGTEFSVVLNNGLKIPEDIAVDFVAKNLYFTDSGLKQILVCKMDGSMCHTLHSSNIGKPRGLALDIPEGLVYWTDWGNETAGIYRSGMDGSRRFTLVSEDVVWPNGLVIDHSTNRLFWADARLQTIEYITLDSKTRRVLNKGDVIHPYSLTVFEDNLYWSDWESSSLETCNKFTGHKLTVMLPENGKHVMGVHVYHPIQAMRRNNPCLSSLCSHMCLIAPESGYRCACPSGFTLDSNGTQCLIPYIKSCNSEQFKCGDGTCIKKMMECNKRNDCEDGSDEKDCAPPEDESCSSMQFRCGSGMCINKTMECDQRNDCDDGSDEKNCTQNPQSCQSNDFHCMNGRCILASWKCDKRDDCGDNSDEIGCPAPENCSDSQFTCIGGECISALWRCDGENDCKDNSDEKDCHVTTCDPETQLRCDHGQCIPVSWACDGTPDCFDSTDERNCYSKTKSCNSEQFKCGDGTCIEKTMKCNNRNDCNDGSDERNCTHTRTCKEWHFACDDGATCIYVHEVCDGHKDCDNGEDEANCTRTADQCPSNEYFCTNNARCIPKRWICDGDDDCGDAEDENDENCGIRTSPSNKKISDCEEYSCSLSGECIPWSKVCNKVTDCVDLMDEGPLCSTACSSYNGGCSQICQRTPEGAKCFCIQGYSLLFDGKTCEDINECEILGSCSHFCNNTKGGFQCSCAEGYFLDHDHRRCKADGGSATLVYLLPDQIRGLDLDTRNQRVYMSEQMADIRGMDYDTTEGKFFWTNWRNGTINSYSPNENKRDILLTTPGRPNFLRWDPIAKNLYYTDAGTSIVVCGKDGKNCTTLLLLVEPAIHGFDIAPNFGFMFWTVWAIMSSGDAGHLERAEMDGSHRVIIVTERIMWPTAVTVDHILEMVYWVDAKLNILECADFHGLKRRTVVSEGMYYPFGMTLFEDYVYWSDWGSDSLIRCDKFSGIDCVTIHSGGAKSEVLMVVQKVEQPDSQVRISAPEMKKL